MNTTAAVLYKKDGYDTSGKRLLGRQSAGEGFLKGLVQFGTAESLYCYATHQAEFVEFCQRIKPWLKRPRQVKWLNAGNPSVLAQAGAIYNPDPHLAKFAWSRRFADQKAYSLCGVTHTIASIGVMQSIGELLIAPIQPWDALICTSIAVKTAIQRILESWADYLALRLNGKPNLDLKLPIIPLGIDCDAFPQGNNALNIRNQLRQKLGIASDDIVVLFVGRLCFYAKAHPVPMYLALEKAAQASQAKVHLIQAGWFEDEREETGFKNSPKVFCPSVNSIFVDGRQSEIRSGIWAAADIFVSLVDNIQETFGLTPIEAMANGLPVIVADWDGYRESVRHEIDGFRIPTLAPPPESGLDLAVDYLNETLNYSTYIAHASMTTAIDIDACTQALTRLITDAALRQRLGESGRKRARETYDWRIVIAAYESLWQELAEIRTSAEISAPLSPDMPPYPLGDDPFRLFTHYPTTTLSDRLVLKLGLMSTPESLQEIRNTWMTNFGTDRRTPVEVWDAILADIKQAGCQSVADILKQHPNINSEVLRRTLVYLLKFNILQLEQKL